MSFLFSMLPSLDVIMALPAISFLLIPTIGSYSTSLNILFFYLTWSTLVFSHSPLNIELWGTLAVRLVFYVLPSALFLLFDTLLPSAALTIKAHGRRALPTRAGWHKLARVASISILNVTLGALLQAGIEYGLTNVLGMRSALKVTTRLPLPWGIAKDLVKSFAVRGALQYYLHRHVLHNPQLVLGRLHRTWQHSVRAPYSFVANYDHPAAWLVGRWLPLYVPAVLFRLHLLTFYLMLLLVSLEEAFAFSGYTTLPGTIMLKGLARRCDDHMVSGGRGNFAPWGVMDFLHGTSLGADVMDDVNDEMKKHDVVARAKRKGKEAQLAALSLLESDSDDESEEAQERSEEVEEEAPKRPKRTSRPRAKARR